MVVSRGRRKEDLECCRSKVQIFSCKKNKHVTGANGVILHPWKLLRVDLVFLPDTHIGTRKELIMLTRGGEGCVNYLDLGNHSTVCMYIKSTHCIL